MIRPPRISHHFRERWALCCICPTGHVVLILVLSECAVAPVVVLSSTFINKENVFTSDERWLCGVVCGMDSDVPFCVLHVELSRSPGSKRGQLTVEALGVPQ